jgi:hypothetical protein
LGRLEGEERVGGEGARGGGEAEPGGLAVGAPEGQRDGVVALVAAGDLGDQAVAAGGEDDVHDPLLGQVALEGAVSRGDGAVTITRKKTKKVPRPRTRSW